MKQIRDIFDALSPSESQLQRMEENIRAKSAGVPTKRPALRRAVSLAAAAALLITAAVSAAAYAGPEIGTAVRTFFSREELISESGGLIERSVTEEGITLSVDGAVKDGDTTYLLCTMTNHEGDFTGQIFTAEWITLKRKPSSSDEGKNRNLHIRTDQRGIAGIYAGEVLKFMSSGMGNSFSFVLTYNVDLPEGEYSLTLTEPMMATAEMDGSISRHDLAEELSVTFPLGQLSDVKGVYEAYPQTKFLLDGGGSVVLESVRISPIEIVLTLSDRDCAYVAAPGYPDLLISPLDWLTIFCGLMEMDVLTRQQWSDIQDNIYHFNVSFRNNASSVDSANTYGQFSAQKNNDGYRTMTHTIRLNEPVYLEDIEKISLVRKPGDTDEIIIWTP